jgi:hypothetical protein
MTCIWDADPACLGDAWTGLDPDVKERSLMLATSSLQTLTYNRVGACPITIRPCPQRTCGCSTFSPSGFTPWRDVDGVWYNSCCQTRCAPTSEVDIPGPVGYIDSLKIDGTEVPLDDGNWRLDDGHLLVWQGAGDSPIPTGQDLNKPDSAEGTWSITYSRSYPVLEDARIAVATLALEFAKACKPTGKCNLPRGVTTVVRNGVTFNVEAGLFPNGLTGIEVVDQFILKWAPAGAPLRTAVVADPRSLMNRPRRTNSVPMRVPTGSV